MIRTRLNGEFFGAPGERLFVLEHAPARGTETFALLVPPFGDEMNKSRRMAAMQARRLAIGDGHHRSRWKR